MTPSRHPINELLELLGHRWTLRVLWELRDGPLAFGELRVRCEEVSTSVLSDRLRELHAAGLVETGGRRHGLTTRGYELGRILLALDRFSRRG